MQKKLNFTAINEGFTCLKCKRKVDPLESGTYRNHCPFCLYCLHVDKEIPGDRASECQGLMKPIGFENHKKKGMRVRHECQVCGYTIWNRTAPDDNFELLCELSRIPQ